MHSHRVILVQIAGVKKKRAVRWGIMLILIMGFGSAIAIYLTAVPDPPNPLGYDPMETKTYLRDLEMYGGKATVLSVQIQEWFYSLWHGRPLAFTLAVLALLLAWLVWFFGPYEYSDDGV
jgi:hypothetical protein